MIRTVLLADESEEYKDYTILNPNYYSHEKFTKSKKRIVNDLLVERKGFISCPKFNIYGGEVHLKYPNEVYNIEYIPFCTDIVLPKNIELFDWIVLFYEQTTSTLSISKEALAKIKIWGNGRRIMGLDECLICDMPFMSLRLNFIGDVDGWVIT